MKLGCRRGGRRSLWSQTSRFEFLFVANPLLLLRVFQQPDVLEFVFSDESQNPNVGADLDELAVKLGLLVDVDGSRLSPLSELHFDADKSDERNQEDEKDDVARLDEPPHDFGHSE